MYILRPLLLDLLLKIRMLSCTSKSTKRTMQVHDDDVVVFDHRKNVIG